MHWASRGRQRPEDGFYHCTCSGRRLTPPARSWIRVGRHRRPPRGASFRLMAVLGLHLVAQPGPEIVLGRVDVEPAAHPVVAAAAQFGAGDLPALAFVSSGSFAALPAASSKSIALTFDFRRPEPHGDRLAGQGVLHQPQVRQAEAVDHVLRLEIDAGVGVLPGVQLIRQTEIVNLRRSPARRAISVPSASALVTCRLRGSGCAALPLAGRHLARPRPRRPRYCPCWASAPWYLILSHTLDSGRRRPRAARRPWHEGPGDFQAVVALDVVRLAGAGRGRSGT